MVQAYLSMVIYYLINIYNVKSDRIIIIMNQHSSQIQNFLLNSLFDQFSIFRICLNHEHYLSM